MFAILDLPDFSLNASLELRIVLEILFLYNPRISEVLNLRKKNIIANHFVILKGAKKSQDVIIRDRSLVLDLINLSASRKDKLFVYLTYSQVYRHIKKYYSHLIGKVSYGKNKKVTHLFRYLNTLGIDDDDSIKTLLHHNSKKSNKFYINKVGVN